MNAQRLSHRLRGLQTYLIQRLTAAGWALVVVGLVAVIQGAISLDIPTYHIGSFATVALGLAWCIALLTPPQVRLTRRLPKSVSAGTPIRIDIDIQNLSSHCLYQLSAMELHLPTGLTRSRETAPILLPRLGPHEIACLPISLNGPKRGIYHLSGLYAASAFPLGLCRGIRLSYQESELVVYPAPILPAACKPLIQAVPIRDHQPIPTRSAASTEFLETRDYTPGDNPRHIHWASWARTGTPTLKLYQTAERERVTLIFEATSTSAIDDADFETAISILAGLGIHLAQQGTLIDQLLTGHRLSPRSQAPLSGETAQARIPLLLEQLASVQPQDKTDWAAIAARLTASAMHQQRVILVALDWSMDTAQFVHNLATRHGNVQTLVVRSAPPSHPLPPAPASVLHYHPQRERLRNSQPETWS